MTTTSRISRQEVLAALELRLALLHDELACRIQRAEPETSYRWALIEATRQRFEGGARELLCSASLDEETWEGLTSLGHELAAGYQELRRAL